MSSSRLEQLGFHAEFATDEQIAVVESLTDEEIRLLVKIRDRMDEAMGDVEGHSLDVGGVVW